MGFPLEGFRFLRDLGRSKNMIYELVKKDLQMRYLGSYLGMIWAFVQPLVTILILWFVFGLGLKTQVASNEYPFILWLMAGMIPWFFLSDSIIGAAGSIRENSYLVKQVAFRVSILPLIKVLSTLVLHLFFVIVLFLVILCYGFSLSWYNLQLLYYILCGFWLVLAIGWITSALMVIVKDIGYVTTIAMQFGFWLTPIFWSIDRLPEKYRMIIGLNPFYYIVQGYRYSLFEQRWFWSGQREQTIYFWLLTLALSGLSVFIFRRLRPHFADVL